METVNSGPVCAPDEQMITKMDLIAFIISEHHIQYMRHLLVPSTRNPKKPILACFFRKTPMLAQAITEWNSVQKERTKLIKNFAETQTDLRQIKARLEREWQG